MDQSESDWGDWSLNNEAGMPSAMDEVKEEDSKVSYDVTPGFAAEDTNTEYKLYDDYEDGTENVSLSGDSENSDDEDQFGFSRNGDYYGQSSNKEGMVSCEYCGRLGVKDAFYSKTKRFCSLACSRNFATAQREGKPLGYSMDINIPLPQPKPLQPQKTNVPPKKKSHISKHTVNKTFEWGEYLNKSSAAAAPVSCFKHCPMSDSWENISVGMKLEIVNSDCDLATTVYWIATVVRLSGYKAQMRYEGFAGDSSLDFWCNLATKDVHPVGWCAVNGKPLVPPKTIQNKYSDWKDFLVKRLTGARTLPQYFYSKVQECINDFPLKKGIQVEVVDKTCVSAMRVAKVEELIGGRLRLQYTDSKVEYDDFWCHAKSSLLHHVGWSQVVGHKLHASAEYRTDSLNKAASKKYKDTDAKPDMFTKMKEPPMASGQKFQVGMKLEAIDPLNLSSICVATVMKVLRHNYLMIGIDGSMAENGSDWFCYHATSPCIFPVGFCEINNLDLTPPRGYKGKFSWFDYLKQTKSVAAPVKLFDKDIPKHGFKIGQKLEAVDLMEPRLICVGTVNKVVGRLLRIHFDGWEHSYDQWVDSQSPDIYPVGWCETVSYHLEGPRPKEALQLPLPVPKKRKSKSQVYRGPRKKRKTKGGVPGPGRPSQGRLLHQSSMDSSDVSQDSFMTDSSMPTPNPTAGEGGDLKLLHAEPTEGKSKRGDYKQQTGKDGSGDARRKQTEKGDAKKELTQPGGTPKSRPSLPPMETPPVLTTPPEPLATKPQTSPMSGLASSLPSIATMLNSPVRHQVVPLAPSKLGVPGQTVKTGSPPVGSLTLSPQKGGTITAGLTLSLQKSPQQGTIYSITSQPIKTDLQAMGVAQVTSHNIPRVIPGEPDKDCVGPITVGLSQPISPHQWSVFDVCQFLRINDCGAYCDSFRKKGIDGNKFLVLTKEQIVNLTGMKVGSSLKIYDLIQALKAKVTQQLKPQQSSQIVPPSTGTSTAVKTQLAL